LIERLNRSLREEETAAERRAETTIERKQAIDDFIEEMEALPDGDDPFADLGHGNEAHDRILYDLEQP
jgi:hypothetical protein